MTIAELLSLLQTIISLLALLVSVVHLVYVMTKDEPYGKKHKKK